MRSHISFLYLTKRIRLDTNSVNTVSHSAALALFSFEFLRYFLFMSCYIASADRRRIAAVSFGSHLLDSIIWDK